MNKTLADLLRLFIVVNLIILALYTLPQSEQVQPTPPIAKQPLPTQTTIFIGDGKLLSAQTTMDFYLYTSNHHTQENQ